MASAIGFRAYSITVHQKGKKGKQLSFDNAALKLPPRAFITKFIRDNATAVQNDERERSWYFEEKTASNSGNSKGYIHYGTFGFESNFVSNVTKQNNYRRQIDDVEEIPLFYEFWYPDGMRSCSCDFSIVSRTVLHQHAI